MPLYEYECLPEGHRFEARQSIKDEPLQTCTVCGGDVRRVIHPVGIVFKGSGFYATDSRSSSSSSKPAADTKASSDSKASTESQSSSGSTGKSESKVDAAAS